MPAKLADVAELLNKMIESKRIGPAWGLHGHAKTGFGGSQRVGEFLPEM